jgi:uncharacterized protein (TIGR02001 family)
VQMRRRNSSRLMHPLALSFMLLSVSAIGASTDALADTYGGSLALTSDYLVRGISRSNHDPALQLDLHYASNLGLIGGVFASNTQIDGDESRDVELSGYVGYTWRAGDSWGGRVLASYYAYPWNQLGSSYNYAEFDAEFAFRGWLQLNLNYSPDSPRYVPYRGLSSVSEASAELNAQRPIIGKLSATAGLGYSHLSGARAAGYVYWGLGAAYDLGPVTLIASYTDTTSEAKPLFYNEAASRRWLGTIIWRF